MLRNDVSLKLYDKLRNNVSLKMQQSQNWLLFDYCMIPNIVWIYI